MRKVDEIKVEMGYNPKQKPKQCATCKHYTSMYIPVRGYEGEFPRISKEAIKRCVIGKFAVRKTACCNRYEELA